MNICFDKQHRTNSLSYQFTSYLVYWDLPTFLPYTGLFSVTFYSFYVYDKDDTEPTVKSNTEHTFSLTESTVAPFFVSLSLLTRYYNILDRINRSE